MIPSSFRRPRSRVNSVAIDLICGRKMPNEANIERAHDGLAEHAIADPHGGAMTATEHARAATFVASLSPGQLHRSRRKCSREKEKNGRFDCLSVTNAITARRRRQIPAPDDRSIKRKLFTSSSHFVSRSESTVTLRRSGNSFVIN